MRSGDREAAAEFLQRYGSRIRRRVRGKLGPSIRRLFDSLEILSTLGRRLDLYVMSGRLKAANEQQLWSLLFKMADHALVDKARIVRRIEDSVGEDSEFAYLLSARLHQTEIDRATGVQHFIDECIGQLEDPTDKRILWLWLAGQSPKSIADSVELAHTALRWRWGRIKSQLKEHFKIKGE